MEHFWSKENIFLYFLLIFSFFSFIFLSGKSSINPRLNDVLSMQLICSCNPVTIISSIVAHVLICLCMYVRINPGPLSNFKEYFSICQWNFNSISAHDYSKLFLLKAFTVIHKFELLCLHVTQNALQLPFFFFSLILILVWDGKPIVFQGRF